MAKEGFEPVPEEHQSESVNRPQISTPEERARQLKEDQELALSVIRDVPREVVAEPGANTSDAMGKIRPLVEAAFQGQPDGAARAKRLLADERFVRQASETFYAPFREDATHLATALFETGEFPPTQDGYERFIKAAHGAAERAMIPPLLAAQEAAKLFYGSRETRVDELLENASDAESGKRMKEALHGPNSVLTVMEDVRTLANDVNASEPDVERAWKERMRQKLHDSIGELMRQAHSDGYDSPEWLEGSAREDQEEARKAENDLEAAEERLAQAKEAFSVVEARRSDEKKNEAKLSELLTDVNARMADLKTKMGALDKTMQTRADLIKLSVEDQKRIEEAVRQAGKDKAWEFESDLREHRATAGVNAEDVAKKKALKQAYDALRTEAMRLESGLKAASERANKERDEFRNESYRRYLGTNRPKTKEEEPVFLEERVVEYRKRLSDTKKSAAERSEKRARERRKEYDAAMRVFAMHPLEFKEQFMDATKQIGGSERLASMDMDDLLARLESARKELVKQKMPVPAYLEWTKRASGTEWIKRKFAQKKAA